jgi:TonB-dependent receptor
MIIGKLGARLLCSCAIAAFYVGSGPEAFAQTQVAASTSNNSDAVETVVVTGTRTQASAIKQDAPNVLDVQSLQDIRSLPDVNAAEALERIPGVSMESDSGEGRFVNIRGMDADLNGTTYDGVRLTASNASSPQGGGRAVAFDAFPSGILGGLEVVKSLTPEMDAEGLGGVVNILPRQIPGDNQSIVDASLGTGLEPLRGTPIWQGDVTAGTKFGLSDDDNRFSILASYAYDNDQRGIDDVEEDYINDPTTVPAGTSAFLASKPFDDLQMRYYKYHRTRQGYGGSFTFQPDDDTTLYLRGVHAGYTELAFKQRLQLTNLADDITSANNTTGDFAVDTANARIAVTDSKENVGNDLVEFGGKTEIADFLKADFRGSWTRGSDSFPYSDSFTFKDGNDISLTYNNLNPNFPSFKTTDGTDLTDPANYTNFSGDNGPSQNSDQEWGGVVNFTVPLNDEGEFKFGGSVRERRRQAIASDANFDDISQGYDAFATTIERIYYDSHYDIGRAPDFSELAALSQGPQVVDPSTFENDNENVYAGYGQYTGTFDALTVQGGLRVEATKGTYRANIQSADADGNPIYTPDVAEHDYTNFFPDLNLKYRLTEQMILRAAFSTAIARPGFEQISAAKSIDVADGLLSEGNPSLKPTTGRSFDLSAEYYMPDGGLATVGAFYKSFSDYIVQTIQSDVTNVPGFPSDETVQITSYANIGAAHAEGVELDYRQKFAFLPDPIDGLGFEGNLTIVGSGGDIRPGEKHTLPQTSPFNYNAGLFYEKGPLDLKIAASYVSRNLWAVGGDDASDLYSQPRLRVDFGGSYQITDNIEYYIDVKDITNTTLEFTQTASRDYPVQREFYGATYLTGIRVQLGQ